MKAFLFYLTITLALACTAPAQTTVAEAAFPANNLITVGVYYYPEQWPEKEWPRDLRNMASLGFEFTHMGEFAWQFMEPEEGKIDFAWLDRAVALAAENGLKVILCTPTATPPAWLSIAHPEILIVDDEGKTMRNGGRTHGSWSSPVYKQYVDKIVTALAQHYGHDRRVWGWQIDNEPSHYGVEDFSPAAETAFRGWLKAKYGSISVLNDAWGVAFWGQGYNSFDQIRLPNPKENAGGHNPHAGLDFKRFSADEVAGYVRNQQQVLRKWITPEQWITSNFQHKTDVIDPWRNRDLDVASYTMYPVAGYTAGLGQEGFRLGNPWQIGFANDYFRSLNPIMGVMELQPGQVNWGSYNPQPLPGAVHMWLWHAFAGGCSFACSYRYRQPLYGSELYHYGMVSTDGVTPLPGGKEYARFITEIKSLRRLYKSAAAPPAAYAARRTAMLWSYDNLWDETNQKQTYQWDLFAHHFRYYEAVKALGAPVDYVNETGNLSKYPVVIATAYQLLDSNLVKKWEQYVIAGGHLVLTCRTGQKDRNGHLWEDKYAAPLHKLMGAELKFYDVLPQERTGHVAIQGRQYEWNNWGEVLATDQGTEILASYTDEFYAGSPAAIRHKLGKGSVTYIGVDTDDGELEKELLKGVYAEAGIATANYPKGLILEWRDGFWVAVNYNSVPADVPLPLNAHIIFGGAHLGAAGVCVWQE